jgi:hypothetical protein
MVITDRRTLDVLLTGLTHFIALAPGKEGTVYFRTASEAHMALPDGTRLAGSWRITESGYHVDWEGGRSGSWQIDVTPGRIAYLDANGVERGLVTRIVPGDAAGFLA